MKSCVLKFKSKDCNRNQYKIWKLSKSHQTPLPPPLTTQLWRLKGRWKSILDKSDILWFNLKLRIEVRGHCFLTFNLNIHNCSNFSTVQGPRGEKRDNLRAKKIVIFVAIGELYFHGKKGFYAIEDCLN